MAEIKKLEFASGVAVSATDLDLGDKTLTGLEASADYTVLDNDGYDIIYMTTGGTDRTVTLPTLADNVGRTIICKKIDSGTGKLILDGEGAETIDGSTTFDCVLQYDFVKVAALSSGWQVIDYREKSAWVNFTPNIRGGTTDPTLATNNQLEGRWRRVGDSLEMSFAYQHSDLTGAANGSGSYFVDIPMGYAVDGAKLSDIAFDFGDVATLQGTAYVRYSSNRYWGMPYYYDVVTGDAIGLLIGSDVAAMATWDNSFGFVTATIYVQASATVPIEEFAKSMPGG